MARQTSISSASQVNSTRGIRAIAPHASRIDSCSTTRVSCRTLSFVTGTALATNRDEAVCASSKLHRMWWFPSRCLAIDLHGDSRVAVPGALGFGCRPDRTWRRAPCRESLANARSEATRGMLRNRTMLRAVSPLRHGERCSLGCQPAAAYIGAHCWTDDPATACGFSALPRSPAHRRSSAKRFARRFDPFTDDGADA